MKVEIRTDSLGPPRFERRNPGEPITLREVTIEPDHPYEPTYVAVLDVPEDHAVAVMLREAITEAMRAAAEPVTPE